MMNENDRIAVRYITASCHGDWLFEDDSFAVVFWRRWRTADSLSSASTPTLVLASSSHLAHPRNSANCRRALTIAVVHRPPALAYKIFSPSPSSCSLLFLFFFILTLIDCAEIMNTAPYGGEPALHIVVLAVMNCPTGPFRSQFLLSTLQRWILFAVCPALVEPWRRDVDWS